MSIQKDCEIKANRPDIVFKNKKDESCRLIDMAIPTDRNTPVKITEKLSKYKDLEIEIEPPKFLIAKLQSVQNSAARLVCMTSKFDHIIPTLIDLHIVGARILCDRLVMVTL